MLFQIIINCKLKIIYDTNTIFCGSKRCSMKSMQIFLRVKNLDELKEISLASIHFNKEEHYSLSDVLWESTGEYYLEAFQCGANPSICSIEKDPRILNEKEEIALMILDQLAKEPHPQLTKN